MSIDFTALAAGAGAGLTEYGHGLSYLDEEERKRLAHERELQQQLDERRQVSADQLAQRKETADQQTQARILGIADRQAAARGAQIHHEDVLQQIHGMGLSPEDEQAAILSLEGVKMPTKPAPRTPSVQRVDTVDKNGKHVVRFVPTDEAANQEFPAYDKPTGTGQQPLVHVTTVDENGNTVEEYMTRDEALKRGMFKKPVKAPDKLFNDPAAPAPASSGSGLGSVIDHIVSTVKGWMPGGSVAGTKSPPIGAAAGTGDVLSQLQGKPATPAAAPPAPPANAPAAAPSKAPARQVGDLVTVRGRQVKISAVYPDGTFDAVDPKTGQPIK